MSQNHSQTKNHANKPPVILLMGPTASGKTQLALELAKHLPIEIISVDSALVYRGMDIGTGKPSIQERQQVQHHLIDIRDPISPYSAADFAKDASQLIAEITQRGRIPLLVGGTLLYFRALQEGLSPLPSADPTIRAKLLAEGQTIGWEAMHQRLFAIDPQTAARLHPNDPQRIQRALEIYEISGKAMSEFFVQTDPSTAPAKSLEHYRIHSYILAPTERAELHHRIEQRFQQMLAQGFVEEVKQLYGRGDLKAECPAMRAVGYRQIWGYLSGHYDYSEMVKKGIAATRQLAKRQVTWLRSIADAQWLQNNLLASLQTMLHFDS